MTAFNETLTKLIQKQENFTDYTDEIINNQSLPQPLEIDKRFAILPDKLLDTESRYFQIENRRYTGSKAKLGYWILDLISKECKGKTFADIFAGTGIVSYFASNSFQEVIVNDFLLSNNLIYKGFFGKGKWMH